MVMGRSPLGTNPAAWHGVVEVVVELALPVVV